MHDGDKNEVSLQYLVIQALVTVLLVSALLLGLRLGGVIQVEDAPLQAVEEATALSR